MLTDSWAAGKPLPTASDLSEDATARDFWRTTYRSGRDYKDGKDESGAAILVQHESESEDSFTRRKRISTPRNYCGPIIRQYNSFVFRKDPQVELPASIEYLEDDADGNGVSLAEFFRKRLLVAQVDRESYIWIDSTAPAAEARTAAQEQEAGDRLILRPLNADKVVDVATAGGLLTEIVFICERDGVTLAMHFDSTYRTEAVLKADGARLVIETIEEPVLHGIRGVPVVRMRPLFDDFDDAAGESQISPIAVCQKKIFNLLSLEGEELFANTYTQWIISAPKASTGKDGKTKDSGKMDWGSSRMVLLPQGATVSRIGSDVAQADSIRRGIEAEERSLYRAAGISAADPLRGTGQPESGVARAFRFNDLAANLSALAEAVEGAMRRTLTIAAETVGAQGAEVEVGISDDFDLPDFNTELAATLDAITRTGTPTKLRSRVMDRFITRNIPDMSEEDRQAITEEVEQPRSLFTSPSGHGFAPGGA